MTAPLRLVDALADRYRIERELGSGGMATVYLAEDVKHRRKVAIKVLRPELSAVLGSERFLKEIELTASLQHPNILPLFDSGSAEGLLYYVMPYVEGETLRTRLEREHQLPIPEAIRIASAVGAALDYAHRHGAVHRDIKPENILLSEDSVLVADFGIALALRDAGGARLTETGLSLGTPQYMSPEQATAERTVDARTDIYSLGATLYEMLAGEPPFTAPTTQGIIAQLLTRSPVRLRVLRDTVPAGLDSTVDRMLAKLPADRFASCREVVTALAAGSTQTPTVAFAPKVRMRTSWGAGLAALVGLAALGAWLLARRSAGAGTADGNTGGLAFEERTQLTTTGQAHLPAISPDGKQLAFVTTECDSAGCSDVVDVQDVGGTTAHRILRGASFTYGLSWSPDRRQLIAQATIGARSGFWLVSALGGPPRYLAGNNQAVAFFGAGDSLITASTTPASDSAFWLGISGLDGSAQDSIRLPDSTARVWSVVAVPGTQFIVAELLTKSKRFVAALIDRQGRVHDQVVIPGERLKASEGALWWDLMNGAIVRQSIEPRSGQFSISADTLLLGKPGGGMHWSGTFDVSADGATLVVDDGTYSFDVWAVEWSDLARGQLPDERRILTTSSDVWSALSPDGRSIALLQPEAGATGKARLSVLPFAGGVETPLVSGFVPATPSGTVFGSAVWADSLTIAIATQEEGHARLERVSARTGARTDPLTLPDRRVYSFGWLHSGGWVWIPADNDRIAWKQQGDSVPQSAPLPTWYDDLHAYTRGLQVSPDGQTLAFLGENRTLDSLRLSTVSLLDGQVTPRATLAGMGAWTHWLGDNTILLDVYESTALELYHLTGLQEVRRVGSVPQFVISFGVSRDMKRAVVATREYRGDIWMSRVVVR